MIESGVLRPVREAKDRELESAPPRTTLQAFVPLPLSSCVVSLLVLEGPAVEEAVVPSLDFLDLSLFFVFFFLGGSWGAPPENPIDVANSA